MKKIYGGSYCRGCFEKQLRIDRLEEENASLKHKLKYQERIKQEGYFGSSTPSSKKPFKENTKVEEGVKNGGAQKGHKGYGRTAISKTQAEDIEHHIVDETKCPECHTPLEEKGSDERTILDIEIKKPRKTLHVSHKKYCPKCKKIIKKKPLVLPKSYYGNNLLARMAVMHYVRGITLGNIVKIFGNEIGIGSLVESFHRLARLFKGAIPKIIKEYREEPVRGADETGWRNDGKNGYCWLFRSKYISIFQFRGSRAGAIALEVLGKIKLVGILVIDRFKGYNRVRCKIQYCYAHLLREVKDLGKEFSDVEEAQLFVEIFGKLLAEAIQLHSSGLSNKKYYKKARKIKREIQKVIDAPSQHLGIQHIQNIFRKNEDKLYQWVKDRRVPADNNATEREIRPTVIARKVSFGSQSKKGAETRSIMMTILYTAMKRLKDKTIEEWFKEALDEIALNPQKKPYTLLPSRPP